MNGTVFIIGALALVLLLAVGVSRADEDSALDDIKSSADQNDQHLAENENLADNEDSVNDDDDDNDDDDNGDNDNDDDDDDERDSRDHEMPKQRDFLHFKKIYHKVYRSVTENMRRAKLYLRRAMHVFKNNIRYLKRKTSKYLRINHMSDWTERERKSIFSLKMVSPTSSSRDINLAGPRRARAKAKVKKTGRRTLRAVRRKLSHGKRAGKSRIHRVSRHMHKKHHKHAKRQHLDRKQRRKSKHQPNDDDDDDEADEDEDADEGESEQRESRRSRGDDKVFLDYREGGCMGPVKSQGQCGACYIFSVTAIFEYQHCKQTGKLVEFSEQYAVDCGKSATMNGCHGGVEDGVADFFSQHGIEHSRKYPFKAAEQTCPYRGPDKMQGRVRLARGASLTTTSYSDMDGPAQIERWLEEKGPLTIGIFEVDDFADYGGGVDVIRDCDTTKGHAMTLIGHGRENGLDYWLIRNSHGSDWGLDGYYKMAKKSNAKCIVRVGHLDRVPKF